MRDALRPLQFVEYSSIQTDVKRREVRFNLKANTKFDAEQARKALTDAGFKEMTVKTAPG